MAMVLRVLRPFGGHKVGDVIDDAAAIREALNGAHKADVMRVSVPGPTVSQSKEG